MANTQKKFNEEIRCLAKKETKAATRSLQSQVVNLRQTVRQRNEQTGHLQEEKKAEVSSPAGPDTDEPVNDCTKIRMSSARVRRIRERLGVTRNQFAHLLCVSITSVCKWEVNCVMPRPDMKARIAALGKMGKRELKKRLKDLAQAGVPVKDE